MPSPKAKVNPDLLVWAREDAGYALGEAASKLNIKAERLSSWESGQDRPTMSQLRRLSDLYKRPTALFFMAARPEGFQVIRDFRRLPGEVAGVRSPALRLELRRAEERRRAALEFCGDLDRQPPPFALRCTLNDDPEHVATSIREALSLTATDRLAKFREWRAAVEQLGALVFIVPSIPTTVIRGFSLAEEVFPVIGVNRKDPPVARSFTLLHELAHLMLHLSGICDMGEEHSRPRDEQHVEVFCNAVAGATLIPVSMLRTHTVVARHRREVLTWTDVELSELAAYFGASREAVLRRLLTFRRTSQAFYQQKRAQFLAEQREREERTRENQQTAEIRRNIPVETLSLLGQPFVRLAFENYYQQRLTLSALSEVLGVKVRHVPNIERRLSPV